MAAPRPHDERGNAGVLETKQEWAGADVVGNIAVATKLYEPAIDRGGDVDARALPVLETAMGALRHLNAARRRARVRVAP